MTLTNLKAHSKRTTPKRRVGRGNGSKKGTYCGRGMNGQSARSGGKRKAGFEGGQMQYMRKMPKLKGFKNPNQITFQVVNVKALEVFENGTEVDIVALYEKNLISKNDRPVKILGNGELTKKLTIKTDRISSSAQEKITKAGGSFTELMPKKEKESKKEKTKKATEKTSEKVEKEENEQDTKEENPK